MLRFALLFLVVAIIAGFFGFGGIATTAVDIAKILFFAFLIAALITFVFGLAAGKNTSNLL